MENCNAYTLAETAELYCLHQFNDRKKHFDKFLPMARLVWQRIFLRTIWANRSKWMPLVKGDPYPYVELPCSPTEFLAILKVDACGDLVPLVQNNRINILPKPAKGSCGCSSNCDCGSLCSGMAAMSFESKDVVIDDETYTEKTWLQVCGDGEVRKWREFPVKQFNTNDPEVYTVVYDKTFTSLCTLEVKPCGCVAETEANAELVRTKCGCSLSACCVSQNFRPLENHLNLEEFKFSDCGTRIVIKNAQATDYIIHYQSVRAAEDSLVPHFCLDAMLTGIFWRSVFINPTKNWRDRDAAGDAFNDEIYKVQKYLNPVDLDALTRIQGERRTT